MEGVKFVSTLITISTPLFELKSTQIDDENEYMSCVPYASIVESFRYLMVYTRPNLAQSNSQMSEQI